jgi:AcrR family transcriptional regulator
MPSDQTRSAILAAAERLYADRGFGDVTLRDIVAAANVNLAAVNYHFGSKDELIAELFVTRSIQTNRERLNELKTAEEKGGGRSTTCPDGAMANVLGRSVCASLREKGQPDVQLH